MCGQCALACMSHGRDLGACMSHGRKVGAGRHPQQRSNAHLLLALRACAPLPAPTRPRHAQHVHSLVLTAARAACTTASCASGPLHRYKVGCWQGGCLSAGMTATGSNNKVTHHAPLLLQARSAGSTAGHKRMTPLPCEPQEPAAPAKVRQRLRQGLASGEGRQQGKHAQGQLVRVVARPLLVAAGQAGGWADGGRRFFSSAADCRTCRLRNATQAAATAVLVQPAASKSRPVAPRSTARRRSA